MERIVRESENMLMYDRPANCFNESLPIGNGRLGACVYAGAKTEKFSINEDTLWTGYPKNLAQEDCSAIFSQVQESALAGEMKKASKLLDNQLKPVDVDCVSPRFPGGSYPNLLCAHPPFQIDGNFGAASGILQMLVYANENGTVDLLPALPKRWTKGEVSGIRIPGKKSIGFAWENGKVKYKKSPNCKHRQIR